MKNRIDAQLSFLEGSTRTTGSNKPLYLADMYRKRYQKLLDEAHSRLATLEGEVSRSRLKGGADSPELRQLNLEIAHNSDALHVLIAQPREVARRLTQNGPKNGESNGE